MQIKRPSDIRSSEITDEGLYANRREFLRQAGLAGLALAAPALWLPSIANANRYSDLPRSPFSTTEEITDFDDASSYNNFYEFGTDKQSPAEKAINFKTHPWSVTVEGECDKPGIYNLEDIIRPHTLEERIYRMRCVEAWSMVIPWVGFPLGDLLKRFQPNSKAKFVAFKTLHDPQRMPGQQRSALDWPYREGLRIDEAMHPLTLLAVGMHGRTLPNQNGAPLRLVVPWKYGFKGIKSIVSIRFSETRPRTSWNDQSWREYGFYANVNPAVGHPRWGQKKERRIGEWSKRKTLPFNGYAEQVAGLYRGMDLSKEY